jgi:pimeloyl-ACP methyl ester carboxylesterase
MNLKLTLRSISRKPLVRIWFAILPAVALLAAGVIGFSVWIVHNAANPPRAPYILTPERFKILSDRGVKATSETWTNKDGTKARGWLLRGTEGKPAVIFLHQYGADASWFLNLGVKLNEATDYTILWPDLRGHGEKPLVKITSFGGCETQDTAAAIEYLRSLKTVQGNPLVGNSIGIYGIELGGYAAILTAKNDPTVKALVLDSVPDSSEDLLYNVVKSRTAFDLGVLRSLSRTGANFYIGKCFESKETCSEARAINNRQIMLLTGADAPTYLNSTIGLSSCFPTTNKIERVNNLPVSGTNLVSTTSEQSEAYDRRVIDFFSKTLSQ